MFQQYSDFSTKKILFCIEKNAKKQMAWLLFKKRGQIVCSGEVIDKKEISKADKMINRQKWLWSDKKIHRQKGTDVKIAKNQNKYFVNHLCQKLLSN